MKRETKLKLNNVVNELSFFLERDFSSRFKYLSQREDRQLFFLARILAKLKQISREVNIEEKILEFPKKLSNVNH